MAKMSYANVASTLALFLAVGGVSYAAIKLPANSVGSTQIKNGAVTAQDINNRTETALEGEQGPQGAPGPAGSTGSTGPSGPRGVPGDKGTQGLPGGDGARGPSGLTGPQGLPGKDGRSGPTGPTGPTGPAAPDNVRGVEAVGEGIFFENEYFQLLTQNCEEPGDSFSNINLITQDGSPDGGVDGHYVTGKDVTPREKADTYMIGEGISAAIPTPPGKTFQAFLGSIDFGHEIMSTSVTVGYPEATFVVRLTLARPGLCFIRGSVHRVR